MKNRLFLVRIIALLILGGGIVNLLSVLEPVLTDRRDILTEIFPLEFLHLSRFLMLLIGFGLIISSINIYKRKRRAFQIVFVLSFLSIIFHVTKGLDFEQALFSFVLVLILFKARKMFTVRSSIPDIPQQLIRFGAAIVIAFAYGIVGFWLLDPKHFGIDFNLLDSIKKTFLFLFLIGDSEIIPRTHYAQWFLDSLYVMTITAVGYSSFLIFRPAIYIFKTLPQERSRVIDIVNNYGRSSLDYFKYWHDKSFFFSSSQKCFIAYRVGGHYALALGDPVGPEEEIEETVRGFIELCTENDWGIGFHQTLPDFLPVYGRLGFKRLKIGDDAIVELSKFSMEGSSMKDLRHAVNKLEKSGFHIVHYDPPIPEDIYIKIKRVSDEWLQIPGRRERQFTLGVFEPDYIKSTPLFIIADSEENVFAFVNMIPSFCKGEITFDLMRRRTDAPKLIMDYLFVKLITFAQTNGYQRLNMGMAPMSGFQEREEATAEERAIHFFFQNLNFLFSYSGLRHYKAKFATSWEPRYLVYRNVLDLPRLGVALSKVSDVKEMES